MLKKTVTYENFNGEQTTEDLYFNLSKSEIVEMQGNGVAEMLTRVTADGSNPQDKLESFKKIIGMAYGVKSEDGRRFRKSAEQTEDFLGSPAYDAVFMELVTGDAASMFAFIQGILPSGLASDEAIAQAAQQAGLDIPNLPSGSAVSVTDVPLPVANSDTSSIPAAFQAKGAPPSHPSPVSGTVVPRPLNEMTEAELREELARARSKS